MIPKIIHYCWFGGKEKPELAVKCINSWKTFCPDYEIREWNEDNFDVTSNEYVRQAYEAKKYAFVTDYVRLYVLYTYGGIYMDTDVMVLKSLDEYLEHEAVSGFETTTQIQTGFMACQKEFPLFGEFLSYYDHAQFVKSDGTYDFTTNVATITRIMLEKGFVLDGKFQIENGLALYPQNVFCPDEKNLNDAEYLKNTATIHYFAGSWKSDAAKKRENSIWWKCFVVPVSHLSRYIEKIGGEPYRWLKKKLWDSRLKEKS